jgi:ketosteroid isomerase-like protein
MFPEQPLEPAPRSSVSPSNVEGPLAKNGVVPAARRAQRGTLAASLAAFALFGGLIGFAADRYFVGANGQPAASAPVATVGSGPRVGPVAAADGIGQPAAAQAAADPTQQAIQHVIQRGDEEQAQAFAGGDPSVMADTSTTDFYQQQVQTNQDLKTNGVTDIKLVNIEWGQISVSGSSATATAFETWSTSYADGTTEQSRDRNVYTLAQDSGAWKITADDHPDDNVTSTAGGAPGGAVSPGGQGTGRGTGNPGAGQGTGDPATGRGRGIPTPAAPPQPSQPRQPRSQNTSANWSGYSATGGTFTAVSGTWTVPQFTPDSTAGSDAPWVGIGGVETHDLIQAGTQQTVSGSGSTQYEAWVETLPQASHPVPLTIHPGDSVSVAITLQPQTQDQWLVSFTNNTTGQTFQVTEHYTSSMSSAEWIEEAPSALRGRQIPLDNFGSIDFSQGSTVKDGQTLSIAGAGAQAITMAGRGGRPQATPSALGSDGASFTVTRASA